MRNRSIELMVGLFMLVGMVALLVLALKVSGLTSIVWHNTYVIKADFDGIGGLKVRAPVSIAGVKIGQVSQIELDATTFKAIVSMTIEDKQDQIPTDSSASIVTSGLVGANYISITPGYDPTFFKDGDSMENTHPALILENLIGQYLFSTKNSNDKSNDKSKAKR